MRQKFKKFVLAFCVIISVFCITVSAASDSEDFTIPSTALLTSSSNCAVNVVYNNSITHTFYNVSVQESTTVESYYKNGCMVTASVSGISGYLNDYYRLIVVAGIDIGSLEVPAGCSYKIQIPFIYRNYSQYRLDNVTWKVNGQNADTSIASCSYEIGQSSDVLSTKMMIINGSNTSNQAIKLNKLYVSLNYRDYSQNTLTADFGFYDSIKVEITKAYVKPDTSEIDDYEDKESGLLDSTSDGLDSAKDLFSNFSFDFEFISGLNAVGYIINQFLDGVPVINTLIKISLAIGILVFLLGVGSSIKERSNCSKSTKPIKSSDSSGSGGLKG